MGFGAGKMVELPQVPALSDHVAPSETATQSPEAAQLKARPLTSAPSAPIPGTTPGPPALGMDTLVLHVPAVSVADIRPHVADILYTPMTSQFPGDAHQGRSRRARSAAPVSPPAGVAMVVDAPQLLEDSSASSGMTEPAPVV